VYKTLQHVRISPHNSEKLNLQQHCCEELKSPRRTVRQMALSNKNNKDGNETYEGLYGEKA
jgi:hypothetical protein